jgi:hypothetical protein
MAAHRSVTVPWGTVELHRGGGTTGVQSPLELCQSGGAVGVESLTELYRGGGIVGVMTTHSLGGDGRDRDSQIAVVINRGALKEWQ